MHPSLQSSFTFGLLTDLLSNSFTPFHPTPFLCRSEVQHTKLGAALGEGRVQIIVMQLSGRLFFGNVQTLVKDVLAHLSDEETTNSRESRENSADYRERTQRAMGSLKRAMGSLKRAMGRAILRAFQTAAAARTKLTAAGAITIAGTGRPWMRQGRGWLGPRGIWSWTSPSLAGE
jgi:hypothetical protein